MAPSVRIAGSAETSLIMIDGGRKWPSPDKVKVLVMDTALLSPSGLRQTRRNAT
jgi:hypothetical protein